MDDLISRKDAIDRISTMFAPTPTQKDMVEDCLEIIANAPSIDAVPQWIPCSERLPEEGKGVVTVDKDGDYEINAIIDEEDGEWFWENPVAWMPLPKPYKAERKES